MADVRPNPAEEIVALIAKAAEDLRVDDFRVRIQRRRPGTQLPEQILTLDGARAEHFTMPEAWLPRIAGGGLFMLTAFHCSNISQAIGGPFPVQVDGAPREVDISVMELPDWTGPTKCIYPAPKKKTVPTVDMTPLSGGHDASPRTTAPESAGVGGSSLMERQFAALQQQKEALAEEKRRMEVDAVRKEGQLALERAERKAEEALRALQAKPVAPPAESGIEKALAAVLPLALEFFKSQKESQAAAQAESLRLQMEMAKMQHETQLAIARTQAEAEARRAEAQAKSAEVQAQMQAQLAAKAEESNKFLLQYVLAKPQDDAATKTSELVASMASTTMNVLNTMVELGLTGGRQEPEEPTALKVVREVTRGIAMMSANAAGARAPMPPQPQPQLEGLPEQQEEEESAPPPEPQVLRAAEPPPNAFRKIVTAIRDTKIPPKDIARAMLGSLADPSIIAAYTAAEGNLREVFAKELDTWLDVPANKARLQSVLAETVTQGVAAGIFPAEAAKELEKMLED